MLKFLITLITVSFSYLASAGDQFLVGTWCGYNETTNVGFRMHLGQDGKYQGASYISETDEITPTSHGVWGVKDDKIIVQLGVSSFNPDEPGDFHSLSVRFGKPGFIEINGNLMTQCKLED